MKKPGHKFLQFLQVFGELTYTNKIYGDSLTQEALLVLEQIGNVFVICS